MEQIAMVKSILDNGMAQVAVQRRPPAALPTAARTVQAAKK